MIDTKDGSKENPTIILAAFGASDPEGVESILSVVRRVESAFPKCTVNLAFTSRFMRSKWRKRGLDDAFRTGRPGVPPFIYDIRSPLAAAADMSDLGCRTVLVQPMHMFAGEEYANLKATVEALDGIETVKPRQRPFKKIAIGRPALGAPGPGRPYHIDLEKAAKALEGDVARARENGAALVYMGHGNEYYSTGYYAELEAIFRRMHPDVPVFVGVVEGFPDLDSVLGKLKTAKADKVHLFPLLLVVGNHAREDMAGDDPESWKNRLSAAGMIVDCRLRPLAELEPWADLIVEHIHEAIADHGLV